MWASRKSGKEEKEIPQNSSGSIKIFLIVALSVISACPITLVYAQDNANRFFSEHLKAKYRISFPNEWIVLDLESPDKRKEIENIQKKDSRFSSQYLNNTAVIPYGTVLVAINPLNTNIPARLCAKIYINTFPVDKTLTLDIWAKRAKKEHRSGILGLTGAIQETHSVLNGNGIVLITLKYLDKAITDKKQYFNLYQYFCIHDNVGYLITCTTMEEEDALNASVFGRVASSLRFDMTNTDSAISPNPYIRSDAIGTIPVPNLCTLAEPLRNLIGAKFIFLPKPASKEPMTYRFWNKADYLTKADYAALVGKVGVLIKVWQEDVCYAHIKMDDSGITYQAVVKDGLLREVCLLSDIDAAKSQWTGKRLRIAKDIQVFTYDPKKPEKYSYQCIFGDEVEVTEVVLSWNECTPIRMVISSSKIPEGYIDVYCSTVNHPMACAKEGAFKDVFLTEDEYLAKLLLMKEEANKEEMASAALKAKTIEQSAKKEQKKAQASKNSKKPNSGDSSANSTTGIAPSSHPPQGQVPLLPRPSDANIISSAKEFVKRQLQSPSSASFPWSFSEYSINNELGGNVYLVGGWVEAQNSYGVKIKNRFIVAMERKSDGFILISAKLLD